MEITMKNNDTWIEKNVNDFNPMGIYSRHVETTMVEDTLLEEATYSPVILEVEDLKLLKGFIEGGWWRREGDSSNSWMWYLFVPKGTSQGDGWFQLPCLWDLSSLNPHLMALKEHLDMLMTEV